MFYLLLGLTWVHLGLKLIFRFFDLSWIDDALNNNNKAALFTISGAYIGLILMYSANIGNVQVWRCILFAGGLGLVAWILTGILIGKITQVFERITIDRDINCGIRMGFYFIASGIILGNASAGDWSSFSRMMFEFSAGWPAIILAFLAIIVERQYVNLTLNYEGSRNNHSLEGAVLCSFQCNVFSIV